jgi:hypothetical protein
VIEGIVAWRLQERSAKAIYSLSQATVRRGSRTLRKVIFGVLLAALVVAPAYAQETGASCAPIADNTERLACYDKLFRTDTPPPEGNAVTIESERLIPALPTGRKPAEMIVACDAGVLTVRFSFAGQLVSATGDIAPVTFQVDQNATAVRTLNAAADNTAVGFWTTDESSMFLNSLVGGTNLKVRMTPVRQRSLTVDFRLAEQRDAIAAVRSACQ